MKDSYGKFYAKVRTDVNRIERVRDGKLKKANVTIHALFRVAKKAATARPSHVEYEDCFEMEEDGRIFEIDPLRYDGYGNAEFEWRVNYGDIEGIYLDMWLDRYEKTDDGYKKTRYSFGTVKTLRTDDEAFREMTLYGAEFALVMNNFRKRVLTAKEDEVALAVN